MLQFMTQVLSSLYSSMTPSFIVFWAICDCFHPQVYSFIKATQTDYSLYAKNKLRGKLGSSDALLIGTSSFKVIKDFHRNLEFQC